MAAASVEPSQLAWGNSLPSTASSPSLPQNGTPSKKPGPLRRVSNLSNHSGSSTNIMNGTGHGQEEVDVVFLEPLDKKYECPACHQVLRYPVQFEECGHRCCSSCLPDLMRVAPRCPLDQVAVDREKVYVDKAFQRETDNLGVRCSFYQRGCPWTGILLELMPHLETCEHRMVICPLNCGVEFEVRFLEKHTLEDCPRRSIQCQFCEVPILAEEEPGHLEVCGKFLVPCPNGCKKKEIRREHLAEHLDTKCLKQEQTCPFGDFGCHFKSLKRHMTEHMTSECINHLSLLCEAVKESSKIVDSQVQTISEHTVQIGQYDRRIVALEKLYGSQLLWKIEGYQEKYTDAKSGKKTTIFSPPFLTSRYGYKLALSACLHGDGKARGKFMSIFVCLCRGEYDALLLWPFSHRVTFTLIDQCQDPESRRNVTYSVKPNICKENKPFLGRPMGERNASFGAQKFVELEILNTLDYIRDDTIFIKVNVDIDEMVDL